jgi:glycerophosphoryl diester phosphodiesterase
MSCLTHGYNVECDVQVLHDNHTCIVFHDDTLDRLAGPAVKGLVTALTPSTFSRITLAEDTPIPLFTDVLDLVARWLTLYPDDTDFCLNIELKSRGTAQPVVTLLQEWISRTALCPHHFLLSSFYWDELMRAATTLHQAGLSIALAVLSEQDMPGAIHMAHQLKAERIHLSAQMATPEVIATMHANGFQVAFYTVDTPEEMGNLLRWGADALFTNRPDRLYSQLDLLAA